FAKEHGISLDAAYKVAISAGAKAGSGSGGTGLSAGLDGTIAGTGLDQDAYRTLENAARESGLSETVSKYGEAVNAIRASSSSSQTDTESGGDRWSVEDVRRKGENY
ncbi:hypothetical protein R0K17_20610, partial [Planococcus sp. SIMBA_143]